MLCFRVFRREHLLRSLPSLSILARPRTARSLLFMLAFDLYCGCKIRGRANCNVRHRANHVKSYFFFFFATKSASVHFQSDNIVATSSCNIMHSYIQKCTLIYLFNSYILMSKYIFRCERCVHLKVEFKYRDESISIYLAAKIER